MRPSVVRACCKSRALKSPPVPDGFGAVAEEFPSLDLSISEENAELQADEWRSDRFDFWGFDRRLDDRQGSSFHLRIGGEGAVLPKIAGEVLTRCQRLILRTNAGSRAPIFQRLLAAHRKMHDLTMPLVRADYDHAIDVWQWVVRLNPDAGAVLQVAALFHDIERLDSEAEQRSEHLATDYEGFKSVHARRGSSIAAEVLSRAGATDAIITDVVTLIEGHESDSGVLADADALSFFSMNSAGFFDHYPPAHCRRKVAYTLLRLDPSRRHYLRQMRLRREVASAVEDELRGMA